MAALLQLAANRHRPQIHLIPHSFPPSFFSSASVPAFCPRKGNLSRSNILSNTSNRSAEYLHPWGPTTPRHNGIGELNFRLGRQMASYQKGDSPPTRVRYLPVRVIQALDIVTHGTTSINIAISDLTWVSFFFLLRPGEYCKGGTDTAQHPFRLKDVLFFIGHQPYNATMASNAVLSQADFVSLLFTTRRTESRGNRLDMTAPETPRSFQWWPFVADWNTYKATRDTCISSFKKGNKWQ